MRLKVITLLLLVLDIVLFFASGYYIAKPPSRVSPRPQQIAFVVRSYSLVFLLMVSLFVTVVLVWMWMQRVRDEYREQAQTNLQSLIEGTLQDHERKKS